MKHVVYLIYFGKGHDDTLIRTSQRITQNENLNTYFTLLMGRDHCSNYGKEEYFVELGAGVHVVNFLWLQFRL